MRPTKRTWGWLALLAGLGALYRVYDGWLVEYLLLVTLLFPPLVGLLSLPGMLRARLHMTAEGPVLRGSAGTLELSLRASSLFPLTVRLRVRTVNLRTGAEEVLRREVQGGGRVRQSIALNTERCGLVRCSAERTRCYDPLGLFSVRVRGQDTVCLLVLPQPVSPAEEPDWRRSHAPHQLRPKYGGGFAEDHDLREYQPGDSLHSIHWKASAKLDQPVVREPLVPEREERLVTFCSDPARMDPTLDTLYWLCLELCRRGEAHTLLWRSGGTVHRAEIAAAADLENAFFQLLSVLRLDKLPEVGGAPVFCRFHVEDREVKVL